MRWQSMNISKVLKEQNSRRQGLSSDEAEKRLLRYGKNSLSVKKKKSLILRFVSQLTDKMIIILLVSALVSFLISMVNHEPSADSLIILVIVFVNAIVGVIQESKAEKAIEALGRLSAPEATVLRDGEKRTVNSEDVVTGDVIFLEKGFFVPADARLIEAEGLVVDESALTGEADGIYKCAEELLPENAHLSEMKNMVFASSAVLGGRGSAVVVSTGMDSTVGGIAKMINQDSESKTPLQKRLSKTGSALGNIALLICAVIFIYSVVKKMPPIEMFLTSVSLAVAAIPEGLPAIVTIVLSIGVQRLAKRKAVVKRLPAVETLGSANVICTDKTGTLTCNKMTVTEVYGDKNRLLPLFVLCNDGASPTENALLEFAEKNGIDGKALNSERERVREEPFSSKTKLMATAHRFGTQYRIIVKGAPDVIFPLCAKDTSSAKAKAEEMAKRALRVIGFATLECGTLPNKLCPEGKFTFIGLAGMIDPPRPEVKEAVKRCKEAYIKPVMITGDHRDTAVAIAKSVGIYQDGDLVFTETELMEKSPTERNKLIVSATVFARATPEFKVKIVEAYQEAGLVVAMTGDGINDAPALKKADIGCAMGKSGTDVAKEASDIVLTDDNFATIVEAVSHGRGIYDNIKRAVHFLLSCNIGEIITVFAAIILGLSSPLAAIQLLWVNLVTDSFPAISLGLEKTAKDAMKRPPIKKNEGLFPRNSALEIFTEGLLIGTLSLIAYIIGLNLNDKTLGSTLCFSVLALSQLFHSFNLRSRMSLFSLGLFTNKWLVLSFAVCSLAQISTVIFAPLRTVFGTTNLSLPLWGLVIAFSFFPVIFSEIYKRFTK